MPVSSEFQNGVFYVAVVGDYAYDEFVQTMIRGYADPNFTTTTPVLIDARESRGNPTSADVREASARILGRRPTGHVGKWAIVTGIEPLRFGIGRMGALTMQSLGVQMEVFTELDAALEYLSGGNRSAKRS